MGEDELKIIDFVGRKRNKNETKEGTEKEKELRCTFLICSTTAGLRSKKAEGQTRPWRE